MNRRLLALALAGSLGLAPLAAGAMRPVRPAGQPEPVDAGPAPEPKPAEAEKPKAVSPAKPAAPATSSKPAAPTAEAPKPPPEPKKIENPAEVTYKQKQADHAFALHVRPGNPKPGVPMELLLDIAKLHDPPDPTYGDREPERDADLVLSLEKSGKSTAVLLHAMQEPGVYGAHVTAMESGVYTVKIARRTGKPGLDASFPLGVGAATPARPDDVLAVLPKAGVHSGRAIRPENDAASGGPALPGLMRQLSEHLLAMDAALDGHGDAAAEARAMAELSKAVVGQTPPFAKERPKEFDGEANQMTVALQQLAASPSKAKLTEVEHNSCWKCHVQFRWGLASDVTSWPAFTPAKEGH